MAFYYRTKDGKGYLCLNSPSDSADREEITKEEFDANVALQDARLAAIRAKKSRS